MQYRASVIFDLDGTLVDSTQHFYAATNQTRSTLGLAPFGSMQEYRRRMTHDGLTSYRNDGLHEDKIHRIVPLFSEGLIERAEEICVYEGVPEMLERLAEAGMRMGVVTSNNPGYTNVVLRNNGIRRFFSTVHCGSFRTPKSLMFRDAVHDLQSGEKTFAVGDMDGDRTAALEAGISRIVSVTYGIHNADQLDGARLAHSPSEVADIILEWKEAA